MSASEILKSITADQLDGVIDADLSAHIAQTGDAEHIVGWLRREYPHLAQFAIASVERYFEDSSAEDQNLVGLIGFNAEVVLGALCRAVEARELPEL